MTDEKETEGLERPTSNDVGEQTMTKASAAASDDADDADDDADDETDADTDPETSVP